MGLVRLEVASVPKVPASLVLIVFPLAKNVSTWRPL